MTFSLEQAAARSGNLFTRLALVMAGAGMLSPALAQDVLVGNSSLLPVTAVGVQDRPRPEYDPLGLRLGLFEISPALTIDESYDDNIYATDRNEVGDSLTTTTATLSAQSLGSLALRAAASVISNQYLHNSNENFLDFNGSGGIGDLLGYSTTINATAQFARAHLSRHDPSFPQAALTPPSFDSTGGNVDFRHTLVRGDIDLNVQYVSLNYHDALLPNEIFLSQDYKDHNELTFDLRDDFLVEQMWSGFLRVIHKEYNYKLEAITGNLNRDVVADTAGGGATFNITNLMKGEIGVGVLRLRNHDAVDSSTTTLSIRSNIQFFVTPILTATATVERSEGAANLLGSSSFISTNVAAALDYEFRRNVILTGSVSRDYRTYSGIAATDTIWQGVAKARWLLNRSLKLDFSYTLASRRSPLQAYLGDNFDDQSIALGVELAL